MKSRTCDESDSPPPQRGDLDSIVPRQVERRVQELALAALPLHRRRTTNLYLERRVLRAGETIGPRFDLVKIERDSVLCFADHQPNANYSHDCQFLLFDPVSGRPLRRIRAKFPPYEVEGRGSLRLFHAPVPVAPRSLPLRGSGAPCPVLPPIGRRFAILFAGVAQRHHVNDLELCYRMLTGPYHLDPDDVFVICHSGNPQDKSGPFAGDDRKPRLWVDGTAFTMTQKAMRPGTTESLVEVFGKLQNDMKEDDLLFIHTNGHGGYDVFPQSDPRPDKGSYLCTWAADNPIGGKYFANTLKDHLGSIGTTYRMLLMLAQQCYGGGFKQAVLNGSTALESSIACAAEESGVSYFSQDRNFTHFTLDWLSAQRRERPDGTKVNMDGNNTGAIEADEAYGYAFTNRDSRDSPNCASQPDGADLKIALSDPNPLSPQWCALVAPMVQRYRRSQPGPQYDHILRGVLPELHQLVLPALKRQAGELRLELTARIERILAEAFGESPPGPNSKEKKVS